MNTSMTKTSVGKVIKKVFKNVVVKRERCKGNWTEKCVIYYGLFWRHTLPVEGAVQFSATGNLIYPTEEPIKFCEIGNLRKTYFVINEQDERLTLGHMLNFSINFNRIIVEVTFETNLCWTFALCGKTGLKPDTIGMQNTFELNRNNVLSILDGICKIRLCSGIPHNMSQKVHNDEDVLSEKFTSHGDQNLSSDVFRSVHCYRTISFHSHDSTKLCNVCKELKKMKEKKTESQCRTPFLDITNTVTLHNTVPSIGVSNVSAEICNKSDEDVQYKTIDRNNNVCLGSVEYTDIDTIKSTSSDKTEALPKACSISLSESDNADMTHIFEEVIKDCPPKVLEFLISQQQALSHKPKGRRWNKNIIRICLTLWCRSPKCYKDLRDSGFLVLPSQRILQIYKNKINQKPGVNIDLLHWMKNEAISRNLPPHGYEGGIILDEMSVQSDLEFCSKDGKTYVWGFTEVTDESQYIDSILSGKKEIILATHVLQFVFLGFSGFRFPLFHFPTKQANASELYLLFWNVVNLLSTFDFTVQFVSMDGAQTNRDFCKILLGTFKSDSIKTMTIQNLFSLKSDPIFVIMDYSHVIKKVRNNINKSGRLDTYKRHLTHKGCKIYWEHFVNAYIWDISHNPFPIHQKLRQEHFQLTNESKMRNSLAEEVLN